MARSGRPPFRGALRPGVRRPALGHAETRAHRRARLGTRRPARHPRRTALRTGIYSGTVSGPDGRLDFGGLRAAARWWSVVERVSKNRLETVCFEQAIDHLRFVDSTSGAAMLPMFGAPKDLSLLGEGRDAEWREALQIDLGVMARIISG